MFPAWLPVSTAEKKALKRAVLTKKEWKITPKWEPEVMFTLQHKTEISSPGMGGTEMSLYAWRAPNTMHAKCCPSRGCFLGCGRVTRCRAHKPGWTNWFVPPPVSILKGDTAMGCIHPLEVGGVIVAPVLSTLSSCQQLRFIYIHSCFPENWTVNSKGFICVFWKFVCQLSIIVAWISRNNVAALPLFFFMTLVEQRF